MDRWQINQTVDFQHPELVEAAELWASYGDRAAHVWKVTALNGGAPANLSGASVSAEFRRDDGNTVLLTGGITGNTATVTTTQEVYAFAGDVKGSLRLVTADAKQTVVHCMIHVKRDATDSVVVPGVPIPDIGDVLEMVEEVTAATEAAQVAANMGAGLNLLTNSGFYANTNGWTLGTNATRDASRKLFGGYSIKSQQSGLGADGYRGFSQPSNASRFPCQVGDVFIVSVYVYIEDYTTFGGGEIGLELKAYDAAGAQAQQTSYLFAPAVGHNGKWTRIEKAITITAANAAYVGPSAWVRRNGTAWFSCPKVERGSVATDWRPSWADILALPYVEDWIAPTILNGWTEVSGYPVRYYKDASGIVRLKGRLTNGSANIAFTFPTGYKPLVENTFVAQRTNAPGTVARVSISASGSLYATTLAAGEFVDLSSISFRAEA